MATEQEMFDAVVELKEVVVLLVPYIQVIAIATCVLVGLQMWRLLVYGKDHKTVW